MSQAEGSVLRKGSVGNIFSQTGLIPGFTFSIFLSALLLFSVQPMFAKMTLPLLGGAPNVWNTAMVFFQATLLAGYVYAHLLSKHAPLKVQIGIHVVVLLAGVIFLPLAVAKGWTPPDRGAPALWLMALYAVSIGVPFFALSATAPLLQRWFSYTDHKNAHDPYFLYAASNLGSLLSLLAYPVLIEPMLGVSNQASYWTFGYYALAIAILSSGVLAVMNHAREKLSTDHQTEVTDTDSEAGQEVVSWTKRLVWIGLAFIPSSLMLGVTTHFSVNVASAPFVWVAPLALYLTTFVIVFASKPLISEELTEKLLPIAVLAGVVLYFLHSNSFFIMLGSHLLVFFIITLRFHGRLAAMRPAASRLTEFYICMSVGGVLGGIFNALIAPVIFSNVYEYAIILAVAGLASTGKWPSTRTVWTDVGFAAATFFVMLFFIFAMRYLDIVSSILFNSGMLAIYAVIYLQSRKPVRFTTSLLAVILMMTTFAPALLEEGNQGNIFADRSFFGVTRVTEYERDGKIIHEFVHGNTIHNVQFRDPALRKTLISYFSEPGPYGQFMDAARQHKSSNLNVHVIGLGAGALACYAKPGDQWTFYEIDPAIARMASDPELFTYLSDCTPDAPLVIGDARLKIQDVPAGSVDVMILDAFSSDAIPAHLVTREAMAIYREKLKEDGIIFFHTSNRFADVSSVVLALAEDAGLGARAISFTPEDDQPFVDFVAPGTAVAVGAPEIIASVFADYPDWKAETANPAVGLWTDDYSHIIGALIAHTDGGPLDEGSSGQEAGR